MGVKLVEGGDDGLSDETEHRDEECRAMVLAAGNMVLEGKRVCRERCIVMRMLLCYGDVIA